MCIIGSINGKKEMKVEKRTFLFSLFIMINKLVQGLLFHLEPDISIYTSLQLAQWMHSTAFIDVVC